MKVITEDDPRLRFVPIETATTPPANLIDHIKDAWWVVHPQKGLVFWDKHRAPQCNRSEDITRRIAGAMYPWAEIRFIPSVFLRINPHDYV
jgi:hypothetical protein